MDADTDLVQHCPGPGSCLAADPVCQKVPGVGRGAGGLEQRREMCSTAASTASAEEGGSGSKAITLPKTSN